jgi:dCMP deaminase
LSNTSPVFLYPKIPTDWDQRFLYQAATVAARSKDPSTKVGAVAVRDRRELATGYNGFAQHIRDTPARLSDRETRLSLTVHAEANLVADAARRGACMHGATIYVYPLMTCAGCAALLINSGAARVVVPDFFEPMRWKASFDLARIQFEEAGVLVDRLQLEGYLGGSSAQVPLVDPADSDVPFERYRPPAS